MDWAQLAETAGGLLIFIYALTQVADKLLKSTEYFKEKEKEKEDERKAEFKELYDEFTKKFIKESLSEIVTPFIEKDNALEEKVDDIHQTLLKLKESNLDLLRADMVQMYYDYLPYQKINYYNKKCFTKFYEDYHSQGGNTFIDEIWEEVKTWEVVQTKEEVFKSKKEN